ncbi:MAG: HEPN domain-containing protein [Desulfosporosinus sp.]|nr:HEPN domain-containing protein [Desulfosporosinus sp.]
MTVSKDNFASHIRQCEEAIEIYNYLKANGYSADFGLRFVWVAAVSALDKYITELIIEKSTHHFSNGMQFSGKILNEQVPISSMMAMHSAPPPLAVIEFRKIITGAVRYRTFQKADDVADGLSFIWNEDHKWNKISENLGIENKKAKRKLNSIGIRRDAIVHNADFDEVNNKLTECDLDQASEAMSYIVKIVHIIDELVP